VGGAEANAQGLYQEIELMRRLEHPHIVRYLGAQVRVQGRTGLPPFPHHAAVVRPHHLSRVHAMAMP
jgi:hypothetical protein